MHKEDKFSISTSMTRQTPRITHRSPSKNINALALMGVMGESDGQNDDSSPSSSTSSTSYPLDVPSPILLGGAMLLAIIGVGTLFTSLTDKSANVIGTVAVVGINVPVSLYLFVAAIKKGQAETEEDDKRLG